mmetsp:Transcript_26591/g.40230  ORF Transcript_26591/g.40230 Transcript_26591/m.40230 type:complete len:207 (+) Transcript_26591:175-795(+)
MILASIKDEPALSVQATMCFLEGIKTRSAENNDFKSKVDDSISMKPSLTTSSKINGINRFNPLLDEQQSNSNVQSKASLSQIDTMSLSASSKVGRNTGKSSELKQKTTVSFSQYLEVYPHRSVTESRTQNKYKSSKPSANLDHGDAISVDLDKHKATIQISQHCLTSKLEVCSNMNEKRIEMKKCKSIEVYEPCDSDELNGLLRLF